MIAVERESPAYRALVHVPPCDDDVTHGRLVIAALTHNPDLEPVAQLIADSREDEIDVPVLALGMECE